jgi:hypothetical protein
MKIKSTKSLFVLFIMVAFIPLNINAMNRTGRLGAGFTNQLVNDLPAMSFKLQKSKSFAFGGVFGLDSSDTGGWGAGVKVYRNIFDEPMANFYASMLGALTSKKSSATEDQSGFQFDFTLGSEFSFTGLNSIGFSFEFGLSLNKLDDFVIQTVGNSFIVAGVHFYL